jgi:asparagine synthase (glutamine-hydrolysing)
MDSTAVATTAARLLAASGGTVVAYTAAPREDYDKALPGRLMDESILAKETAAMHPNMEHVVIRSDRTPMANLARTASIYGVPVMNICNEGWFDAINDDAAGRGITVMLEGALGNGTISESGILALHELLQSGRIIEWLKLVARILRKGRMGPARVLWLSFSPWLPNGLYEWLIKRHYGALLTPSRFSSLKSEQYRQTMIETASESRIPGSMERVLSSGWIRRSGNSLHERLALLGGDDGGPSCKGMLGEWKIDYRDPTTDRRLVEFSFRVPAEEFISDGAPRTLIRKVLADRVPKAVLETPLRGYQAADWHEWMDRARDEIAAEIERIEMFEPSGEIVDTERLKALFAKWPDSGSDEWNSYDAIIDYRCCMLRAIAAASFMRHAARSNY